MAKLKLRGKDLIAIGYPQGKVISIAIDVMLRHYKRERKDKVIQRLKTILATPDKFMGDGILGKIAEELVTPVEIEARKLETRRAPFEIFGENNISESAKHQLYTALKLPVARKGALMLDGHSGYGLPIGGVLATENAVIPYGVGVDIGCRMCLSIYDINVSYLQGHKDRYLQMLMDHTKFGGREVQKNIPMHDIFEHQAFSEIPMVKRLKGKAFRQLGSSGGGNHFVEFGEVTITSEHTEVNVPPGKYLGILSHSGSRGLGASIAKHYTKLAMAQNPLPSEAKELAWLDLNTHDGQEYWMAMNLAGEYASACHDDIHKRLSKALGSRPLAIIENHHNFAWKEQVDGKEMIVHRKGATPAGKNVLGIIPGSMTAPGYIVSGKGSELSINSASHGAGRSLSRRKAKMTLSKTEVRKLLKDHGVSVIGGGIDEAPMAYKDINKVMGNQTELVNVLGTFLPKLVRMDKN